MSNEKNLSQQAVEFTELVDSEMEQISGGGRRRRNRGKGNYGVAESRYIF